MRVHSAAGAVWPPAPPSPVPGSWLRFFCLAALVGLGLLVRAAPPTEAQAKPGAAAKDPASRAREAFLEAKTRHEKQPTNAVVQLELAKAAFDWADFPSAKAQREPVALAGIQAARQVLERDTNSAPAHYYLALNLGQLARTKTLGALKLVREMEKEFLAAIQVDAQFEFAGPERSLGMLYMDAPGWPTSIGSRAKSRQHLERAVELHPGYPDNRLSLMEACLKWGEAAKVPAELKKYKEALPEARARLTGPDWEQSWKDWDARAREIEQKIAPAESRR